MIANTGRVLYQTLISTRDLGSRRIKRMNAQFLGIIPFETTTTMNGTQELWRMSLRKIEERRAARLSNAYRGPMHARGESFRKWPTAGHVVSESQELHMHKTVFEEDVIECEVSQVATALPSLCSYCFLEFICVYCDACGLRSMLRPPISMQQDIVIYASSMPQLARYLPKSTQ